MRVETQSSTCMTCSDFFVNQTLTLTLYYYVPRRTPQTAIAANKPRS